MTTTQYAIGDTIIFRTEPNKRATEYWNSKTEHTGTVIRRNKRSLTVSMYGGIATVLYENVIHNYGS